LDPHAPLPLAESDFSAFRGPDAWTALRLGSDEYLEFKKIYNRDRSSAYAMTKVYAYRAHEACGLIGSDDGIRCWLNGQLVHENDVLRDAAPDDDACLMNLRSGWNTLLFKVSNETAGHGLYFRLSEDPVALGRALLAAGKKERALKVLNAHQDDPWLLRQVARIKVQFGLWKEASSDFARVLEVSRPLDHWEWFHMATVFAASGNTERYSNLCLAMYAEHKNTDNGMTADIVSKTSLLLSDVAQFRDDAMRLAEFAKRSSTGDAPWKWRSLTQSLAAFRKGQLEEAVSLCQIARDGATPSRDCAASAIEAMCLQHLGAEEKAILRCQQAKAIYDAHGPLFDGSKLVNNWYDWLVADILCREADETLSDSNGERQPMLNLPEREQEN
jgi:tetratricopeptide (TPR) repeat protein